ncbi:MULTISPECIES: hypothetical protein [Thalassospira]|jgi:hypothetical protein|uniref:Uncharacterized protein n=1 Tax=Thalassospira profundimaris TaxID=502049 RepID=A0A367VGR0_9PROT|nr:MULTISPECIES: hypothetical protein [Thalassospira]KZB71287.1 hypothetical protein AUQ43_10865 [Thalassospira sp. MCCC 1A01148]MBS8275193.1 hypothetical protein [Thalassospira tepidiphila]RCK24408.1 hypothetical protein TH6_06895 [Thalassospira profundimaris]
MIKDTAFIGIGSEETSIDPIQYISNYNISELDYLFWNSATFSDEFSRYVKNVYGSSSENTRQQSCITYSEKTEKLIDFSENGGNIVIFTGGETKVNIGFGRRDDPSLLEKFRLSRTHGKRYKFIENEKINRTLNEIYSEINYSFIIKNNKTKTLITVPRTEEVISSFYLTDGGGIVIAMPLPTSSPLPVSKIKTLISDIKAEFSAENSKSDLPRLASNYHLPLEHQKTAENKKISEEIQAMQAQIDENRLIISKEAEWKHLFSSHDEALEKAAAKAFEELGFLVGFGPKTHCDIVCVKEKTILAVEVKGLKRSAKPANVNQCKRWISDIVGALDYAPDDKDSVLEEYVDCLKKLGVKNPSSSEEWDVKGVVVINTFRNNSLEDRNDPSEPSFNKQVRERMKRENICGMTGIQLLNLVIRITENPSEKESVCETIIKTAGQIDLKEDWKTYISKVEICETDPK